MQRGVDIGENNHQNEHQKQRDRKRDDSSKVHCPREKTWFAVESCPAVGAFIVHLHPMPEHDSLAALWAALVRNRFDVSRFVWLAHLKNICFWFTVRSTIVADSSLLQWSGSILVAVGPVIMQFRLQASKSPSFGWQEDTATSAPMRTDFFHQCQPTAKLRSEQPRWRGHRMVAGSSIVCNRLLPPTNYPPYSVWNSLMQRLIATAILIAHAMSTTPPATFSAPPSMYHIPSGNARHSSNGIVSGATGKQLDDYLTRLEAYGMAGSILVAKDGKVMLHKGYGIANRHTGEKITAETPFILASLSKQFTAAAVLKLAMQRRLTLQDTVGRFYPLAPPEIRAVTLHQLLCHTSGLPYLGANPFAPMYRDSVMWEVLRMPLEFPPGSRAQYSSPGYTLLAGIIERASGKTFEEYLRKNLFGPAGMANTRFQGEAGDWPGHDFLHSYSDNNDEGPIGQMIGADKGVGAGTVISTTGDLRKWEEALWGGKILNKEHLAELLAPRAEGGRGFSYAYGWNVIKTIRGTTVISHAGDFGGYNTELRHYVDEGYSIIFTSNTRVKGAGFRQAVVNNISLILTGGKYAEPPHILANDETSIPKQLLGSWRLQSGGQLIIQEEQGKLLVGGEGSDVIGLLAGAPKEESKIAEKLSALAAEILAETAQGKFDQLQNNLHPSLPFAHVEQGTQQLYAMLRDSLGEYEGAEIIGTGVTGPQSAETYWRLKFQRGETIGMYGWAAGKIMALDADLPMAMQKFFLPEDSTTVAAFDVFTGQTVRVSLASGGAAEQLTITSAAGTATAAR